MSVPKRRKTSSSVRQGRSHQALKEKNLGLCSKCGKSILPHTACGFCGDYKGEAVLKVKTKSKK